MKNIIVALFGAVTSVITAAILFAIEKASGFSVYSWTFWFIFPLGAGLSGFAAATGYYLGAWLVNVKPGSFLLAGVVVISTGTFFLIHYMSYYSLLVDGEHVRNFMSFSAYLNTILTQTSISFSFHAREIGTTGKLGFFGYLYALLQILGFGFGGLVVYYHLRELPYCESCSRYLKRSVRTRRYTENLEELNRIHENVGKLFQVGNLADASAAQSSFGSAKSDKKLHIRTEMTIWECKGCAMNHAQFGIAKQNGGNWKDIPELKLVTESKVPHAMRTSIA
jgi:hypothetical protein